MGANIAIIFAGGSGARMGSGLPKQFIEVNGKPIIIHTLDIFEEHPAIDKIYIACKEDYISKLEKFVKRHFISKVAGIVPGGATGQDSIYNALSAAAEENDPGSVVLIHDGVRPCITSELIDDVLECVKETIEKSEKCMQEVAGYVPEYASEMLSQIDSKRKREAAVIDHNMAMVAFFVPLMGEIQSTQTKIFTEKIVE